MTTEPFSPRASSIAGQQLSRRGVLRIGGITVGLAAVLAACVDEEEDASPARVGEAPPPSTLPEGVRTDGVLFRTATSLHFSIIDAYNIAKDVGELDADQTALVDALIAANQTAIGDLQQWSEQAGSQQWTCANPRFDRVILTPIKDRITGRPKQGTEENDIEPSDDPARDAMVLVLAMETVAAETHQSFVPQFSKPEYRKASMTHGESAARRAAAVALAIDPANVVDPTIVASAIIAEPVTTEASTTTTVQDIAQTDESTADTTATDAAATGPAKFYAIPSQFGALSFVQIAVGAPTAAGTTFTINIETPSLNSFIYDYMTDADCVASDT